MGKHFGKCALCGKECDLTFEHIPPRKAFNWIPEKTFSGDSIIRSVSDSDRKPWDFSGFKFENNQKGIGAYTLCQSCNNLTGTWYGDEYVTFAKAFHFIMVQEKPAPGEALCVKGRIKPLPVIKQVASMFCSINPYGGTDSPIQSLRDFVLDKESKFLPKDKFRIGMYLFGGGIRRRCPYTVMCLSGFDNPEFVEVSEIATYPLGFMLYFDPNERLKMPCTDITTFSDFDYNEELNFEMTVPVHECNIIFPGDFRSKAEINSLPKKKVKTPS